jgi:hypothetical protein
MSFWSDIVQDVQAIILGASGGSASTIAAQDTSGLAGTQEAAQAAEGSTAAVVTTVEGIWSKLTDWRIWASLGWILLGVALMFLGLLLWMRRPIESAIGTAAKAVAL